ncbi:MAG: TonB family protein [Bacteroidota bacterium]
MKNFAFLLLFAAGCAAVPLSQSPETLPVLVFQAPLPAVQGMYSVNPLRLELKMYVGKDGAVQKASFVTSSGDADWDATALIEIKKWKFLPAMVGGKPVPIWINQGVIVRFQEPLMMALAEIVCPDRAMADSVYELLVKGEDFDVLARTVSTGTTRMIGAMPGSVDIRTFPFFIQEKLERLKVGNVTEPIQLGQQFVIYKRLSAAPDGA